MSHYENITFEKVTTQDICTLLSMVFKLKEELEVKFPDHAENSSRGEYWANFINTHGMLMFHKDKEEK